MRWVPLLAIVLLAVAAALHVGGRGARGAGGPTSDGARLYILHCASCHAADGRGRPPAPRLARHRFSESELRGIIVRGHGRMEGAAVRGADLDSLVRYVHTEL